jgi:DNA-binding MarR family transcriptional regulator
MPGTLDNETLIFALFETADRLERRLDRALSHTRGISFREYQLLRELSRRYGGTATRVELAAAVGLTPSAVTRALKPLEKLGYIVTEKSDRDARRSLAILTPGGSELLIDAQSAVDDVIALLSIPASNRQQLAGFLKELGSR